TVAADFIPILEANPETEVINYEGIGRKYLAAVINHRNKPFSDVKVRRAIQALQLQGEFSAALGVPESQFRECFAMFVCGTVYDSDSGFDVLPEFGVESAKKLLAESSYSGEVVRVLVNTD